MMRRISPPSLPTAVAFFGRQTSSDLSDMGMSSAAGQATGEDTSMKQPSKKQLPLRSNSLRNLVSSFSWNKRFGGDQKGTNMFGSNNKVDNVDKQQDLPAKKSNLKPPPVYAIEVKTPPSIFDSGSSRLGHPPAPRSFAPTESIPTPTTVDSCAHKGILKTALPPSAYGMEDNTRRIPPAAFPSDTRDVTLPSRGATPGPRRLSKDTSLMTLNDRPNKPQRQSSKMPPKNHLNTAPKQMLHSSPQYHRQQQQYHQGAQLQPHDFVQHHRRHHTQQFQSPNYPPPHLQGSPGINGPRSDVLTNRQDQYGSVSSAFTPYSASSKGYGGQQWASRSARRLKDPPPPPPPPLSTPPSSGKPRPAFSKSVSSPAISTPRKKSMKPKKDPVYLEIFPGNTQILRGADETTRAMRKNFVTPCKCISCTVEHLCIADAAFVICPMCRCISQAPDHALNNQYGVGLGFVPQYEED